MNAGQIFGKVFREARKRARLTQEQVALIAGLDRSFVSLIERGKKQPTIGVVFKLAAAVKTTATELVRLTEESAVNGNGSG